MHVEPRVGAIWLGMKVWPTCTWPAQEDPGDAPQMETSPLAPPGTHSPVRCRGSHRALRAVELEGHEFIFKAAPSPQGQKPMTIPNPVLWDLCKHTGLQDQEGMC